MDGYVKNDNVVNNTNMEDLSKYLIERKKIQEINSIKDRLTIIEAKIEQLLAERNK